MGSPPRRRQASRHWPWLLMAPFSRQNVSVTNPVHRPLRVRAGSGVGGMAVGAGEGGVLFAATELGGAPPARAAVPAVAGIVQNGAVLTTTTGRGVARTGSSF